MNEFWQMFTATMSAVFVITAIGIVANRMVLSKAIMTHKDEYKERLEKATRDCEDLTNHVQNYQSVERQLLELKADLPLSYVRKEDFIRHEVTINAKLDRIYDVLSKQNKPGGC